MLVAPTVGRWLWKKYRANAGRRSALPAAAMRPNTSTPQEQI